MNAAAAAHDARPGRLPGLDALRGIAALVIAVFWHYSALTGNRREHPVAAPDSLLVIDGYLAVDLFFLLSGMVIAHVYWAVVRSRQLGFSTFLQRRVARLWPLHVLTLNCAAVLFYAHRASFGESLSPCRFGLYDYLLNLVFAQSSWWSSGCSFNAPSWTLSIEMFLYVTFFACAFVWRQHTRWLLVIAGYGLWMVWSSPQNWGLGANYGRGLFAFYLGVAALPAFRVFCAWIAATDRARQLAVVAGLAAAAMASLYVRRYVVGIEPGNYVLLDFDRMFVRVMYYDLVVFPLLILLFGSVAACSRETVVSRFLGNISYSSYLLHIPMIFLLKFVFAGLGLSLVLFTTTSGWLMFVAALLVVSGLSFYAFETPSRRWIQQLGR